MSVRCILFVVVSLSLTCWAAEEDTSVISSDPLVIGELPSLEEFRSGIIQQQPVEVVIAITPEVFIDNDPDVVLIGSDDGKIKRTNFAAARIGAVISSTNPEAKGASSLLTSDPDNYWMSPCSAKKWVVITLPEDVLVDSIVLSNQERYSSQVEKFTVTVSSANALPTTDWRMLGDFTAQNIYGEQLFNASVPQWGRHVRIRINTHYGSEFYCTMSSIKVYGETGLDAVNKPGGEEYMVPIVQVPVVSPLVLPTPDPSPSPAATAITTTPTATQEPTPSSVSLEVSSAVAVEGNGAVNGSAVVASADPSTSTVDDHSTVSKSPSNSTVSSESSSTLNVTKATPVVSEVPSFSSNITSSLSPEVTQTPSPSDTPVSTPSLPPTSVPTLAPNEEKPVFEPAVPPIPSLSTSPTQQPSELPSALLEANISTVGSLLVAVALNISDGLNATTVSANASANVSAVPVEPVADLETTPSPSPLVSQAAASDDPLPTPTATSTAVEDASRDASLSNVTSPSTDGTVAVEEDIDVSDLIGTAVVVEQAPAPSVPAPVNENMMHTMPPHTLWASAGVPLEMASKTSTALKSFSDRLKALEFEQEVVRKYLGEFQAKFNVVIERVQTGIDTNKADITNLKVFAEPSALPEVEEPTCSTEEVECSQPAQGIQTVTGNQFRALLRDVLEMKKDVSSLEDQVFAWRGVALCALLALALSALQYLRNFRD